MADPTKITTSPVLTQPVDPTMARQNSVKTDQTRESNAAGNPSFAELLRTRQGLAPSVAPSAAPAISAGGVRFSAHAQTRLNSRQISLGASQLDRLDGAVKAAAGKGSRDALVLMDDLAMVVSVQNRTVVTVVDKANLKQNVFTNIDSAVIA